MINNSLLLRTAGNCPSIQVRERSAWVREFPDVPRSARMLSAFLTGGKQEISARQPSRNSYGVGRGRSSIAGKSDGDAANHIRFWHLADIGLCAAHVCF